MIFRICREIKREYVNELKGKMNFLDFKILHLINSGLKSQKEIVEISGLSKGTVSKALKSLESEGYIRRYRKGREYVIELTSQGMEIFSEFDNLNELLREKMLLGFEDKDKKLLEELLLKIVENMEDGYEKN